MSGNKDNMSGNKDYMGGNKDNMSGYKDNTSGYKDNTSGYKDKSGNTDYMSGNEDYKSGNKDYKSGYMRGYNDYMTGNKDFMNGYMRGYKDKSGNKDKSGKEDYMSGNEDYKSGYIRGYNDYMTGNKDFMSGYMRGNKDNMMSSLKQEPNKDPFDYLKNETLKILRELIAYSANYKYDLSKTSIRDIDTPKEHLEKLIDIPVLESKTDLSDFTKLLDFLLRHNLNYDKLFTVIPIINTYTGAPINLKEDIIYGKLLSQLNDLLAELNKLDLKNKPDNQSGNNNSHITNQNGLPPNQPPMRMQLRLETRPTTQNVLLYDQESNILPQLDTKHRNKYLKYKMKYLKLKNRLE